MSPALPIHPTLIHPRTGLPLQAIGWTRGRIIWPVLGGDGTNDGGGTGDSGTGQGDNAGGTGGDNAGGADGTNGPKLDGDLDKERAARAIAAAREGEKKAKAEAAAAKARTDAILKAAGLTPDGKEDPEAALKAAAADRDANATKARTTAIELAVYKSAGKAGVDPDAVLDSRNFLSSVSELDPEAADFGDKIVSALKAALKANTKLAALATATTGQGSGTGRQGADHTGGANTRTRSTSLAAAVKTKLGG